MKEQKHKQQQRPIPPPPTPPIVVPQIQVPQEKRMPESNEKKVSSGTNNRCAWRDSSPINTTLEVKSF